MAEVHVKDGEDIDKAIHRFQKQVEKDGDLRKIKEIKWRGHKTKNTIRRNKIYQQEKRRKKFRRKQ